MDKNLKVYNTKKVVEWYNHMKTLVPVEKKIFDHYSDVIKNGKVLDIGIGGGRTTRYLFGASGHYTGIDYSQNFITSVKKEYSDAKCLVMDARDLSAFKNESFDVVNFSFNGIDYVDPEGRTKIISEAKRVLKPNGLFFFSTHNKAHSTFNRSPWLNRENSFFTNFKTLVKLIPFLARKFKQRKNQILKEEYALITDSAHNFSLLTFYTTPSFLRSQLLTNGFENIEFFSKSGEKKEDKNLEDWIFVTARKISA